MKIYLLIITLALASAQRVDYGDLTASFPNSQCHKENPRTEWGVYNYKSPIAIENSGCLPYGKFELTMTDIVSTLSFDNEKGAPSFDGYAGAKLTSDQFVWTSDKVLLRLGSEHRLLTNNIASPFDASAISDIEVQILMNPPTGSNYPGAVLSFLLKEFSTTDPFTKKAQVLAMQSLSGLFTESVSTYTLALSKVAQNIKSKMSQDYYLNMYTYNGTNTYTTCEQVTWFIYGSQLYVDSATVTAFRTYLATQSANVGLNSAGYNIRDPFTATYGGGGAQKAARLCFSGYFDVYLNWNYGLWFGTVIIVMFFILTLSIGEYPITDYDYVEEAKTVHPLVSLWKYGNELHTRKSRASLILAQMTIHALFSSVFYRISNNRTQKANIIVYAVYSMIISQVFIIMFGSILRKYYVSKSKFVETKEERWNQRAQNNLFAYYSGLFFLIAICWPFCVWNMNELNPHHSPVSSNYWVASFFIGLALEYCIIDVIWALLAAKSMAVRRLMKQKGFMYDNLMHNTYMTYIKMD